MTTAEITPSFTSLPNRGLIIVGGEDAFKFLQNIVTNNMNRLDTQSLLHACLLTAQGKFQHDFFISKNGDDFLLDCEGGERTKDLLKLLTLYRLRSKVTLEAKEQNEVYAVGDERHFTKPDLPEKDFAHWDRNRITRAIADGSRDAEIGKSTLSDLNLEESAVDYNKGCYIGQELTARIHHRGLAKRHLLPVKFDGAAPEFGTSLTHNGKTIGDMRSSQGDIGLALLKDEVLPSFKDGFYLL